MLYAEGECKGLDHIRRLIVIKNTDLLKYKELKKKVLWFVTSLKSFLLLYVGVD